jgi:methyl-accepting chemotaxis protein|nr:MAG TPA: tail tape measure [Caudoviricetes sp.]
MAGTGTTRDIRTRLTVEGEKQLKQALSENASEARKLKSDMDLLTAEFDGNTDSQEYLAKKSELVQAQMDNARRKVELYEQKLEQMRKAQQAAASAVEKSEKRLGELDDALEKTADQYGDNSEEAEKLRQQIREGNAVLENQRSKLSAANTALNKMEATTNKAKEAVEKLKKAIKENAEETDEAEEKTEEAKKSVESLSDVLDDASEKLGIDVPQGAKTLLKSFEAMDDGISGATGGILAAIGLIIAAMKEVVDISKEGAAAAGEILKISQNYGIATEDVQKMQYAASMLNVEFDELLDAYSSLVSYQGDAATGSEENIEVFRRLGVSIKDNKGNLKDTGTLMFEVFDALGKMGDETQRNVYTQKMFGETALRLNSIISDGGEQFRKFTEEAEKSGFVLSEDAVNSLNDYNQALKKSEMQNEAFKNSLASLASGAAKAWQDMLNGLGLVRQYFISGDKSGQIKYLPDDVGNYFKRLFGGRSSAGHAAGTPYFRGGETIVGEYGPERVILPEGTRIQNANDTAAVTQGATVYNTINISVPDLPTLQKVVEFYSNYELTRRKM